MKKTVLAVATAAMLAAATLTPTAADARCRGCGVAAGVFGGLALGAIVGGAIASSRPAYAYPAYAPAPGYVVYEGYAAAGPVPCPGGYWAHRPIVNPYGQVVGYTRPRFFCP